MNIQIPTPDGYQASREIRRLENKDLAGIPIIALTANTFDKEKWKLIFNPAFFNQKLITKLVRNMILFKHTIKILKNLRKFVALYGFFYPKPALIVSD